MSLSSVKPDRLLGRLDNSENHQMTIAEFFGAVLLYLLTVAPVKAFGFREFKNSTPGDPAFYQTPLRSRAYGAHMNGIETFPFFAAAVLLAEFRGSP
jgi:uncharacterized MAPEG superfamily protein